MAEIDPTGRDSQFPGGFLLQHRGGAPDRGPSASASVLGSKNGGPEGNPMKKPLKIHDIS